MEIKAAVIAHLRLDTAVLAAFGYRITADKVPDGQLYPNARIWLVSDPRTYHMTGPNVRKVLLQIDVYDETSVGVDANKKLIETALSGYRGVMGDLDVGRCFVKGGPGLWNAEARNHHRILEVEIGTND
jgi:hypothetical protein